MLDLTLYLMLILILGNSSESIPSVPPHIHTVSPFDPAMTLDTTYTADLSTRSPGGGEGGGGLEEDVLGPAPHGGLSTGEIVGMVVGVTLAAVLLVGLAVLLVYCCCCRGRQQHGECHNEMRV